MKMNNLLVCWKPDDVFGAFFQSSFFPATSFYMITGHTMKTVPILNHRLSCNKKKTGCMWYEPLSPMPKLTQTKWTTTLRDTVRTCRCCLRFPSYDVIFKPRCTAATVLTGDSPFIWSKVLGQMIGRFRKVLNVTLDVHYHSVKLLEGNVLVKQCQMNSATGWMSLLNSTSEELN